jgi:predicted nucleic acid-binding protein
MIIVDTTVWIDFFSNNQGTHVFQLEHALKNNRDICICGVILTEILQGIHDDKQYEITKMHLDNLIFLSMNYHTFIQSANIYRFLRKKGITIGKPIDCMIAAVAIENDIPLLHNDRDFEYIEKHLNLKVVKNTDDQATHFS